MACIVTSRLYVDTMVLVHVLVSTATAFAQLQNVALNKDAHQSSTLTHAAPNAVDGNTNQFMDDGLSCIHTAVEKNPFWEVDLGDIYVIDHIKIYNRLDSCCTERAHDVLIELSKDGNIYNQVCFNVGQIPNIYTCEPENSNLGRWVKVSIVDTEHLHICEVEVMSNMTVGRELFQSIPSVKGTGSVVKTVSALSAYMCAYHCSREIDCLSVNVVNTPIGVECQLLGSGVSVETNEANTSFWKLEALFYTFQWFERPHAFAPVKP